MMVRTNRFSQSRRAWLAAAVCLLLAAFPTTWARAQSSGSDSRSSDETKKPPKPSPGGDDFGFEVLDAQGWKPNSQRGLDLNPAGDPIPPPEPETTWVRAVDEKEWLGASQKPGVFADGTSVLVIHVLPETYKPQVKFTVEYLTSGTEVWPQTAKYVGSFWTVPLTPPYYVPALPAPDEGSGEPNGSGNVLYYRPPNNFLFGNWDRKLKITATSGDHVQEKFMNLYRPTVVLNHGFFSDPASMGTALTALTKNVARPRVLTLDWSKNPGNTSGYDAVPVYVKAKIADEVLFQRCASVAATRVDFFGHSMGGAIVKWYVSDLGDVGPVERRNGFRQIIWLGDSFKYLRDDNFGIGDVRRLVTVGSPFQGSPFGDVISALGRRAVKKIIDNSFGTMHGDGCAVDDLGFTGPGTEILAGKSPKVSWCPMVGIAIPKTAKDLAGGGIIGTGIVACFWAAGSTPYKLQLYQRNSDLIVWRWSATNMASPGPWPPENLEYYVRSSETTHVDEPSDEGIIEHLEKCLDLYFSSPGQYRYVDGYTFFNSGF